MRKPDDVIYFTAVMYEPFLIKDPDGIVSELFGPFILRSDTYYFDHTAYYEREMGVGLRKYFAAFGGKRDPGHLAEYKHTAIAAEAKYAADGNRTINIDPGYLAAEKVVVASTKNFTHRVYIGDGIFGDVQLMRQKGEYSRLPWTYTDYIRKEAQVFFQQLYKLVHE